MEVMLVGLDLCRVLTKGDNRCPRKETELHKASCVCSLVNADGKEARRSLFGYATRA
jgi:hypothetical protein